MYIQTWHVSQVFFISRTHTCHASKMHDRSGNSDCLVCISWLLLTGRCDCLLFNWSPVSTVQDPPADRDGPKTSVLPVGRMVHRGVQQTPSHLVRQRPHPRHHTPQEDEEQRFQSSFSVNTLLLLQACGAVFPTALGIPHWCGSVVCCYSNRCTPVWTVQWRERENLPQQQHLSWGWEKTEGHKGRGEWRVSVVCHRKNNFTVCSCNLPKSLIFVLFSGVKGVWNLHPYPEQKVPGQRSVCACLLLCLFLKNNNLNINNHLQLQDLQHTNSSSSSKGTVASPSGFCTSLMVSWCCY